MFCLVARGNLLSSRRKNFGRPLESILFKKKLYLFNKIIYIMLPSILYMYIYFSSSSICVYMLHLSFKSDL